MPWVFSTCWIVRLQVCPQHVSDITSTRAIYHIAQLCLLEVLNRSCLASDWVYGHLPLPSVWWHYAESNSCSRTSLHLSGSCTSSSCSCCKEASSLYLPNWLPIEAKVYSAEFRYRSSACKCSHPAGILDDWYWSSSSTSLLIKKILLCLYISSPLLQLVSFSIPFLDWFCSCLQQTCSDHACRYSNMIKQPPSSLAKSSWKKVAGIQGFHCVGWQWQFCGRVQSETLAK